MRTFMIFMGLMAFIAVDRVLATPTRLPPPSSQATVNASLQNSNVTYAPAISKPITRFQVSTLMESGSLQMNIRRLAAQFGWSQVVWDVPNDYEWVGTTRITSTNFNSLLERILVNYPLQATLYHGNHVLVISSRNI